MHKLEYPKEYVVWDLETTGLDPRTCHIVEVAAIRVSNGKVVQEYSAILNHDVDIPEEASKVHGITREIAKEKGIDPKKGLMSLFQMLLDTDVMITHNGHKFDIPFFYTSMFKHFGDKMTVEELRELETRLYENCIDTAVIAKARKLGMNRRWNESFKDYAKRVMNVIAKGVYYNVSQCCKDFGIDQSKVTLHRAGGDVEMTHQIYEALLKEDGCITCKENAK